MRLCREFLSWSNRVYPEVVKGAETLRLLALDLEDRIEAVNTPLEMIYPIFHKDSRGKKLAEILPADLMEQLDRLRENEEEEIHNLHRYRIRHAK